MTATPTAHPEHRAITAPQAEGFGTLRAQLTEAAQAFADGPDALAEILLGMVDDVDHALAEPLEVFPVCHHSPASAIAMARRLRAKQPRVIYLELCEDMAPLLTELRHCTLPVALQAFASQVEGFPVQWSPLSVIAPITEASAEYQAIAYALTTPGVELVLVDRSTDHVFQWEPREALDDGPGDEIASTPEPRPQEDDDLHGEAVGVQVGDLRPRFAELEEYLLRHGRVRHWSEWWHHYVEGPLGNADEDTYRQALLLLGSLFRRLCPEDSDRLRIDEDRERYMWTRIREHLATTGADPSEGLYICGAFHAVSRVAEFGVGGATGFEISPRSGTQWQYGLIPSSHRAIEAQFGLASGSVSIAASTWAKNLQRTRTKPWRLTTGKTAAKKGASRSATPSGSMPVPGLSATPAPDRLTGFLQRPPAIDALDEAELLTWSVSIVGAARRAGYLASTADAIAVFETSILLAGLRDRANPTPYDFADAAVTCIEKDVVPGRRDVASLVATMLGADRRGTVGYESLPPLARDVYDRLEPLGLKIDTRGVKRALLDLSARPELSACSDVLWRLRYLMPQGTARPIMGERRLGVRSIQESWDLAIGTHQRALIELGYEGVSLEQVLEQRLRRSAFAPKATVATVLAAVEDALVLLDNRRLADELGAHALAVLTTERGLDSAPEVLRRTRRLVSHLRTVDAALPSWINAFVAAGYAHYCTLLPVAFAAEDSTVEQVTAALGFVLTLETLALSLGCDRSQLDLAIAGSHPTEPERVALRWAVQVHLGVLTRGELRSRCQEILANPMLLPGYPRYLRGLVQALEPVPGLVDFVVESISTAFGELPDSVLLPWLPTLVLSLRSSQELAGVLVREAERTFPHRLDALDAWVPPWQSASAPEANAPRLSPGPSILAGYPDTAAALARLLVVR